MGRPSWRRNESNSRRLSADAGCAEVGLHRMQWPKNPYAWANGGKTGSALAVSDESVWSMQVRACQESVVVQGLTEPVAMVLSTGPYDASTLIPQARFWDPSLRALDRLCCSLYRARLHAPQLHGCGDVRVEECG